MFVLISYDIQNDKKRNRVFKHLSNIGFRVQFSVFECDIDDKQLQDIKSNLESFIDLEYDSIRYYILCEGCRHKLLTSGIDKNLTEKNSFVV
jgi:CRISPR-associated protein Cas2